MCFVCYLKYHAKIFFMYCQKHVIFRKIFKLLFHLTSGLFLPVFIHNLLGV